MTSNVNAQNTTQPVNATASSPTYSVQEVADYLTNGFWYDFGTVPRKFNVSTGGTLTYSLAGVDADAKWFIVRALDAWSVASGLIFKETTGSGADIDFIDSGSGAYAYSSFSSTGQITKSYVNVNPTWYANDKKQLDSYSYQTFVHEIGHALGLGHGGNYNGTGNFATEAHYKNDSWQMSVMSYFAQWQNPYVNASGAYTLTPMIADIYAIQDLYGTNKTANLGATNYGYGGTSPADGPASQFRDNFANNVAMTVIDSGGEDIFDFRDAWQDQNIDLRQGGISDVDGLKGNLLIALGTVIENAKGGSGNDTIIGNNVSNDLFGNQGDDKLLGQDGNDKLFGGLGSDSLSGGNGADKLSGGGNDDQLFGRAGADSLYGATGNDVLEGQVGFDLLKGGDGKDTLRGGDQRDTLFGDAGNDFVYGGRHADKVNGGSGNDQLYGGGANDVLKGNKGRDRIDGGSGHDKLYGGQGADSFVFSQGKDRIKDFHEGENDKIFLERQELSYWKSAQRLLKQDTKMVDGDAVISFGDGNSLVVENVGRKWDLLDDISFI